MSAIQLRAEFQFASHTTTDWFNFCREVAIDIVINNNQKIGGPDKIVEIDESKFGKRNHCRNFLRHFHLTLHLPINNLFPTYVKQANTTVESMLKANGFLEE